MKKCIICGKFLGENYKWEFQVCDECVERHQGEKIITPEPDDKRDDYYISDN